MKLKQLLWLVCALCIFCNTVAAQANSASPSATPSANSRTSSLSDSAKRAVIPPEKAKAIAIPRFDKPPVIDGKLDDEVWKQAVVFKDFLQTSPGDNIAPSKPTEAMIGYDSKTLYFAFHCYDEPSKVRATVGNRDEIFGDGEVDVGFQEGDAHFARDFVDVGFGEPAATRETRKDAAESLAEGA